MQPVLLTSRFLIRVVLLQRNVTDGGGFVRQRNFIPIFNSSSFSARTPPARRFHFWARWENFFSTNTSRTLTRLLLMSFRLHFGLGRTSRTSGTNGGATAAAAYATEPFRPREIHEKPLRCSGESNRDRRKDSTKTVRSRG